MVLFFFFDVVFNSFLQCGDLFLNIGSVTSTFISYSRQGSSTLDQADDNRHNRQNEKNVDEASHCVGGGKSKCPKNEQNHSNCPKHVLAFLECWSAPRRSEVAP